MLVPPSSAWRHVVFPGVVVVDLVPDFMDNNTVMVGKRW
jgi:hypothetical protein